MIEAVRKTIKDNNLISQGDRVVVGVSGGADSVCLFLCLYKLREELGFTLSVVHINHMIRGKDADRDEEFVKELCEKYSVSFKSVKIDVREKASKEGLTLEEAGRNARYEAFEEEAQGGLIAVAHHKDDQEETILFNILRGSSLKGIGGMQHKNGHVIRPLLDVSRSEIEQFLKKEGQTFRKDKTNDEDEYTRNKIRKHLLPYIKQNINEGAGERLIALGRLASEADEKIESDGAKLVRQERSGCVHINAKELKDAHISVRRKAVYLGITMAAGRRKDIESKHVEIALELADKQVGTRVSLPYGLYAEREYEEIFIGTEKSSVVTSDEIVGKLNDELAATKPFLYESGMEIPEERYRKWFDYDKLTSAASWRPRLAGDTIEIKSVGTKPVGRYMIDCKIPRKERELLPLLAVGNEIVWIPGYRISEKYKITESTKNVIEIMFDKEVIKG